MIRKLLLGGILLSASATVTTAAPSFYVQDVREVCQLPRANNNGKVLGHDNGSSVLFNGTSYWFFADTGWDANGNGVQDPSGDGFIGLSTVASTTDLNAADCMDMTYRANGGTVQSLFPGSALHSDECLLWSAGAVAANNQIYVYAEGVKKDAQGHCVLGNPTEVFLARVDPSTMAATRVVTTQAAGVTGFNEPLNVSEPSGCGGTIKWVYLVGTKSLGGGTEGYLLGRVTEANIEDPTQYQYWNGSTWVVNDPSVASPIFSEFWAANAMEIFYNTYLGRYMAVYTCGLTTSVCARTALTAGKGGAALTGGWSDPTTLYSCPGDFFNCYAAYPHPEYGHGSTLYITTAQLRPAGESCSVDSDCFCPNDPNPANQCINGTCTEPNLYSRYGLRMREVKISTSAPPAGLVLADAGRDYTPKARCGPATQGSGGWYYRRLNGSTFTDLTFDYLWNWIGPDSVSGFPAPAINEDTAFPGTNTDAVRVWQAPGAGTAEISGEARKRYTCGDSTIAEIIRIQNNTPVASLWSATLTPASRAAIYHLTTSVSAGDSLGFKVKRGGTAADCDEILFEPTITYTP
jgi:hypothetical protein